MGEQGLLSWQWAQYAQAHRDRRNLLVHGLTNPLFLVGSVVVLGGLFRGLAFVGGGLLLMAIAMALQGKTHRLEETPPAPFRGPVDVVLRIFAEQWITFPRYVLSGGFARAWRAAR